MVIWGNDEDDRLEERRRVLQELNKYKHIGAVKIPEIEYYKLLNIFDYLYVRGWELIATADGHGCPRMFYFKRIKIKKKKTISIDQYNKLKLENQSLRETCEILGDKKILKDIKTLHKELRKGRCRDYGKEL